MMEAGGEPSRKLQPRLVVVLIACPGVKMSNTKLCLFGSFKLVRLLHRTTEPQHFCCKIADGIRMESRRETYCCCCFRCNEVRYYIY